MSRFSVGVASSKTVNQTRLQGQGYEVKDSDAKMDSLGILSILIGERGREGMKRDATEG